MFMALNCSVTCNIRYQTKTRMLVIVNLDRILYHDITNTRNMVPFKVDKWFDWLIVQPCLVAWWLMEQASVVSVGFDSCQLVASTRRVTSVTHSRTHSMLSTGWSPHSTPLFNGALYSHSHWSCVPQVPLAVSSWACPRRSLPSTTLWKTAAPRCSPRASGCSTTSLTSCTDPGDCSTWTPRTRWPHRLVS